MKIDPVKQAPVPAISGEDLLATVPEVANLARVEVKNISNVPSDYMDPPRWIALTKEVTAALARPDVSGVIISHGTDTLEETAWWLDLTVDSEKPIVLIGAQRNASEKDFDGPRNLLNAVRICVDAAFQRKGRTFPCNQSAHDKSLNQGQLLRCMSRHLVDTDELRRLSECRLSGGAAEMPVTRRNRR